MSIKLFWQGGERKEVNFGDTISPLIVEMLSGEKVTYAEPHKCDMIAIGSILDKTIKKSTKRKFCLRFDKIQVWGSGSFGVKEISKYPHLAVHAVRGPLTRAAMNLPDDLPMGDPGLFISKLVAARPKKYSYGIIPHVTDISLPIIAQLKSLLPNSIIIDLAAPNVLETAAQISECDMVISSSLHGIVSADAYGIPNVWMRVSDNVFGGDYKFLDYFQSVGRTTAKPVLPDGRNTAFLETAEVAEANMVEARQKDLEIAFKRLHLR